MRTYTAAEAAALTGRGERTIRRMIERGQLRAQKHAITGHWLIQEIDLPQRKQDPLDELRAEIVELRRELEQLKAVRSYTPPVHSSAILPMVAPDIPMRTARDADVRLSAFAEVHGVPRRTASDHAERGKIPTERRPQPGRPGERPHWLTPEQQRAAVTFWRVNYSGFTPCHACPHDN